MAGGPRFAFPPEEAPWPEGAGEAGGDADDAFRDDLFESISEAHYLPALEGHDEALLESLVEKGCEDNQILELPGDAPVADVIGRLQALESPSRSAAQGLLHLHRLPPDAFAPEPAPDAERRLRSDGAPAAGMYTEQIPDLADGFDYDDYEPIARPSDGSPLLTDPTPLLTDPTPLLTDATPLLTDPTTLLTDASPIPSDPTPLLTDPTPLLTDATPLLTDATPSERIARAISDPSENLKPDLNDDENDLVDLKFDSLEEEMDGIDFKLKAPEGLKKEDPKVEIDLPTDLSAVVEIDLEESPAPAAAPGPEPEPERDDLPKDLSMPRRAPACASPRRIDIPRAPSRESDAMQSPQPSGIPAIASPEVFNASTRNKNAFLEILYASSPSSPKMYTSEVTIQPCVPLNLGKHRKSASPTVSSCSDDIRNASKEPGEPQEKRARRESHDLAKICNLLKKCGENKLAEAKKKRLTEIDQLPPLKQLELLKSNKNFNLPDHVLVPRDRLNRIITAPGKEIPALLMERPQLNMAEILQDPNFIGDPELMVISLEQIRQLIIHNDPSQSKSHADKSRKASESEHPREHAREPPSGRPASKHSDHGKTSGSERNATPGAASGAGTPQPSGAEPPGARGPALGHLADDIDAANTASAYHMNGWLPAYLEQVNRMHQLEAVAACSQNAEFLKALGSSAVGPGAAYGGSPYPGLSQMFHPSRFMGLPNVPMMPPLDYESRMLAMWHEAAAQAQRHKEPADFASPYAQALLRQAPGKAPARAGYGAPRGAFPAPPLPFYVPRAPAPRGSPDAHFANNNYLQSAKQAEARGAGAGSPRPRISVKSLQELQHSARAAAARRAAPEPEVGSTTSGEAPPHDPAPFPLWHPLFSNQKGYTSPWSWTTVTATGD